MVFTRLSDIVFFLIYYVLNPHLIKCQLIPPSSHNPQWFSVLVWFRFLHLLPRANRFWAEWFWLLAIRCLMNVSARCRMGFRHCELTKQETSCLLSNAPSGALIMSIGDETWSSPAGMLGCAACCIGCVHRRKHWSSIVNHDYRLVGAGEIGIAWQHYSIFMDCINIIIAAHYS